MNAKFEWFGFSVARKHVYFYILLVAASLLANTVKDQLVGSPRETDQALRHLTHMQEQMAEVEAMALR